MGAFASMPAEAGFEVWFADLGQCLAEIETEEHRYARLSADELIRVERVSDLDQRRLWRAAHIALRDILERICGPEMRGVPFVSQAGGRPELAQGFAARSDGALVSFSLSHTADVALIGISRAGAIGVDIEKLHSRNFSADRRQRLETIAVKIAGGRPLPVDPDRRFLQAWTRIEALSKADGRGVLHTLTHVGGLAGAMAAENAPQAPPAFEVRDLEAGAFYCASIAGRALPQVLAVKAYVPLAN